MPYNLKTFFPTVVDITVDVSDKGFGGFVNFHQPLYEMRSCEEFFIRIIPHTEVAQTAECRVGAICRKTCRGFLIRAGIVHLQVVVNL